MVLSLQTVLGRMQDLFQHAVDGLESLGEVRILESQRVLYLGQLSDLRQCHHRKQVLVIVVGIHVSILFGLFVNSFRRLTQRLFVFRSDAKLIRASQYVNRCRYRFLYYSSLVPGSCRWCVSSD